MEYNTTPPNSEFIRDNYGQFVMLNEHNEIMRYSNNGTAIYCCEDPPATPIKNLKSSVEHAKKNIHNVIRHITDATAFFSIEDDNCFLKRRLFEI